MMTAILILLLTPKTFANENPYLALPLSPQPNYLYEIGIQLEGSSTPEIYNMAQYYDTLKRIATLESNLKINLKSSSNAKESPKTEDLQFSKLENYVALRNYLMKTLASILPLDTRINNPKNQIQDLSKKISATGNFLLKTEKPGPKKDWIYYQVYSLPPEGKKSLSFLQSMEKTPKVSEKIRNRINLILLASSTRSSSVKRTPSQLEKLESDHYRQISKLSPYAQISAALSLAKAYSQISEAKNSKESAKDRYQYFLRQASDKSRGLPIEVKSLIVREIMSIWVKAEGRKANYLNLPFDLNTFSKTILYLPIRERIALTLKKKSRDKDARKEIYFLVKRPDLESFKIKFLSRLLNWAKIEYQKKNQSAIYEREIIAHISITSNNKKKETLKYVSYLKSSYRKLVEAQLNNLKKELKRTKKDNKEKAIREIGLLDRYIKIVRPVKKEEVSLNREAGLIYASVNEHSSAVSRLLKSALDDDNKNQKSSTLNYALASQKTLAGWPSTTPWSVEKLKTNKTELERLRQIYTQKYSIFSNFKWDDIANAGLIDLKLNKDIAAAKLWSEYLQKNSRGASASKAAYLTISIFKKYRSWDELEDTARHLRKVRVNPSYFGKSFNSSVELATALFENGKQKYAVGKFDIAVKKFDEYVSVFNRKNEDEARLFLAQSLWKNKDYSEAVDQTVIITKSYKSSKYWNTACLLGFDWSRSVAFEDKTIYFGEIYVNKQNDDKAYALRHLIAKLYVGLEKYSDAMRHIQALINMPQSTQIAKNRLQENLLDLSHRYGKLSFAVTHADKLLKQDPDQSGVAKAYMVKAKFAESTKDYKALKVFSDLLNKLNSNNNDVIHTQAFITYLIAVSEIKNEDFLPVLTSSLKNPLDAVKKYERTIAAHFLAFRKVCDLGASGVCPQAMNKFDALAKKIIPNIEDITINDSLDERTVSIFNDEKSQSIAKVRQMINSSYQIAYSKLQSGNSLPETIQDTLWRKGMDWNFEPISSTPGNGYISWRVKN